MAEKSRVTLYGELMITPPFEWRPANDRAVFPRRLLSQELRDDLMVWDELFQAYFRHFEPDLQWSDERARHLYGRIAPRLVDRMRQELDPELYEVDMDLWPLGG